MECTSWNFWSSTSERVGPKIARTYRSTALAKGKTRKPQNTLPSPTIATMHKFVNPPSN
jgi:hypothetical protein